MSNLTCTRRRAFSSGSEATQLNILRHHLVNILLPKLAALRKTGASQIGGSCTQIMMILCVLTKYIARVPTFKGN